MKVLLNLPALAAVVMLTACSGMEPIPEDKFHRVVIPSAPPTERLADSIRVRRFAASSLHQQRPLVYVDAGGASLKQYRYHLWEQGPERMLQLALADYLRESGVARAVTVTSDVPADWEIGTVIRRFELVVTDAGRRAVVALVIQVTSTGGPADLRLVRDYTAEEVVSGAGLDAAVEALSAAMAEVFQRFAADLGRELAQTR